jgi:hypothetical protein
MTLSPGTRLGPYEVTPPLGAGGPLPLRKAVEYGAQIATGLAAAHNKGIVHHG